MRKIIIGCLALAIGSGACGAIAQEAAEQNENGTDHGSQGPMFLIGGKVAGGVYGNHPRIDPVELDGEGNTRYRQNGSNDGFESTDFRDVYGTILTRWLDMSQATVLSSVLALDGGSANSYWTAANFNVGFLP